MPIDHRSRGAPILAKATEVWKLIPKYIDAGMWAMWKLDRLHSIACVGVDKDKVIRIPLLTWTLMRKMGEVLVIPTSCYIPVHQDVYFASWHPISGIGYTTLPDDECGGVVGVIASEFSIVQVKPVEKTA